MAIIQPEASYTVTVRITNQSIRAGNLVAARLRLNLAASINGITLIPPYTEYLDFGPGQTRNYPRTFAAPANSSGKEGSVEASVQAPDGSLLAVASEPITVGIPSGVVTVHLSLLYPPDPPWNQWTPWWYDGVKWVSSGQIPFWFSVYEVAGLERKVPTEGYMGFTLHRSDTGEQWTAWGAFGPVMVWEGAVVSYNFRTEQVTVE